MSHVAWCVCVSVCLCIWHTSKLCKNVWTNRDAVWGLTHVDPRNHVLDGVKIWRIRSPPRLSVDWWQDGDAAFCQITVYICFTVYLRANRIHAPMSGCEASRWLNRSSLWNVIWSVLPVSAAQPTAASFPHILHPCRLPAAPSSTCNNRSSTNSANFCRGLSNVAHRRTDKQTDHATPSVAIVRMLCNACDVVWILQTDFENYLDVTVGKNSVWLVAWHSGRMSGCDRRTFPVLRSTCSWWVTTYVGKPWVNKVSQLGQPNLSSFRGRQMSSEL